MSDEPFSRYLIQIDQPALDWLGLKRRALERPDEPLDIETVRAVLEPAGVAVDVTYGPICINAQLRRYVVRGTATVDAKIKAEQIAGVRFFHEAKISPTRN